MHALSDAASQNHSGSAMHTRTLQAMLWSIINNLPGLDGREQQLCFRLVLSFQPWNLDYGLQLPALVIFLKISPRAEAYVQRFNCMDMAG